MTVKIPNSLNNSSLSLTVGVCVCVCVFSQQYFYEYVDFEPASRPRHVCPYAVVSFQFKAKEAITAGPKASPLQRYPIYAISIFAYYLTYQNGI